MTILSVIFHAAVGIVSVSNGHSASPGVHSKIFSLTSLTLADIDSYLKSNAWLWYFPYAAGLVAIAGRTVGMMVLDLRVVRLDHGRVGIAQSIWRYFLALFCALTVVPLFLGWFWRMQLYDRFSSSRLIGGRTGLS